MPPELEALMVGAGVDAALEPPPPPPPQPAMANTAKISNEPQRFFQHGHVLSSLEADSTLLPTLNLKKNRNLPAGDKVDIGVSTVDPFISCRSRAGQSPA